MQRQHSALMTQGRPHGSKKKNLKILSASPGGRPDADLLPLADLEVRDPLYPYERTFGRMLVPTRRFRNGGTSGRDLNKDINVLATALRLWHASEWYVGTRVPAAEPVKVSGSCLKSCVLQQMEIPAHP